MARTPRPHHKVRYGYDPGSWDENPPWEKALLAYEDTPYAILDHHQAGPEPGQGGLEGAGPGAEPQTVIPSQPSFL